VDIYKTDGPSMTKTKASPLVSPAYQLRPAETGELKLTNDGQLSLFFVGVGSAFSKRHFQTNLLIVKGQDHVLVDCGTKTPQALYELGLPLPEIRNYFLTHSHADHIGGLEEVMLVNRYGTGSKPHVWITEGYQNSLWDMSLKGGGAFNEESDGKNLSFGDFWAIHRPQWLAGYPRETYGFEVGSIRLKAFRTMHVPGNAESWERAFWSWSSTTGFCSPATRSLTAASSKTSPRPFRSRRFTTTASFYPRGGSTPRLTNSRPWTPI
jgi:hypothetical protein